MANHGFSAPAITAFGQKSVEYYYLIRVDFAQPVYFSLAPFDIDFGGNTYNADGLVLTAPKMTESLKIKPSTMTLQMSGASPTIKALTLTGAYRNKEVFVYLHEVSTGETIQIFKGFIENFKDVEDDNAGKATVSWTVANHWTNWKDISGRFLSNENQQKVFAGDLGLEYSSFVRRPTFVGENAFKDGEQVWVQLYSSSFSSGGGGLFEYRPEEDLLKLTDEAIGLKKRLPIIYGKAQGIAGSLVFNDFVKTEGFDSVGYYVEVYALSEGKCDALEETYIDGATIAEINAAAGKTVVEAFFEDGDDNQAANAYLLAEKDNLESRSWSVNHRLRGITNVVVKYLVSHWRSKTMVPPLFDIRGKLLYDPRDGTTYYSQNTAMVLMDYLRSSRYGKGLTLSELGGTVESTTLCAFGVLSHNGSFNTPGLMARYEFNGVVDASKEIKKNVETMLFAMQASLPYIGDKYTIQVRHKDETGTFVADDDNISKLSVYDANASSYMNEIAYDYSQIQADGREVVIEQVVVSDSGYLSEDNGKPLRKSFNNKFEVNKYRATNNAKTLIKESREQLRADISLTNLDAIQIEAGNLIKVTAALQGWVQKLFRVQEFIFSDVDIMVKCREYEAQVYDWSIEPEELDTKNSQLGNAFVVNPPTAITLLSNNTTMILQDDGTVVPRILVTWQVPDNLLFVEGYYVYYNIVGAPAEDEILFETINNNEQARTHIFGIQDGINYDVSVSAFNELGFESARVTDSIIAIGKDTAPTSPIDLNILSVEVGVVNLIWTHVPDLDFHHYAVTSSVINNRASGFLAGETTGNTFNHATSAAKYYWIRAFDTSGNPSSDYFPVLSTAGKLGTPNGNSSVADWETLAGKPYDGLIINTISARMDFESQSGDFDNWHDGSNDAGNFGIVVQDSDSFMGSFAGLFTSTKLFPAWFQMPRFDITVKAAQSFAGKKVRVSFWHKKPTSNASPKFAMMYYSTATGAHSGYVEFNASSNTTDFITDSFTFDVPKSPLNTPSYDLIVVQGNTVDANGVNGVLIDNIVVEIVGDASLLAEITAGSGVNILPSAYATFEDDTVPLLEVNDTCEITSDKPYSGNNSLLMTAASSGNTTYVFLGVNTVDYNIKLTPNRKWILSGVCFMESGTGTATLRSYFYGDVSPNQFKKSESDWTVTNDGNWHEFVTEIDLTGTHSAITEGMLRLDLGTLSSTIKVAFDHLMIEEKIGDLVVASGFALPAPRMGDDFQYGAEITTGHPTITVMQADISSAQIAVIDAQDDANKALEIVDEIDDDLIFSPAEKRAWQIQWSTIQANYLSARDTGNTYGVNTTPLNNARNDLSTYLVTTHSIFAGNLTASVLTGTQFSDKVELFYEELQIVLMAISDAVLAFHGVADNANVSTNLRIVIRNNYRWNSGGTATESHGGASAFRGYDATGAQSDSVPPFVTYNGFDVALDKDYFDPNIACEGYIVWLSGSSTWFNRKYVVAFPQEAGSDKWTVYGSGGFQTRTMNDGDLVIGTTRLNSSISVNYATVWGYAIHMRSVSVYNSDKTNYDDYRVTNRGADNNVLFIKRPRGGSRTDDITKTGAIVIVLPENFADEIIKFKVDVTHLSPNGSFTIGVGGRMRDSDNTWQDRFAQIYGNIESNNDVRFGRRVSDNKPVIMIGYNSSIWDDPKVTVYDVQVGDQLDTITPNYQDWDDNWEVAYSTTGSSTYNMPYTLSDALLDARSIIGQGALALLDSADTLDISPDAISEQVESYTTQLIEVKNSDGVVFVADADILIEKDLGIVTVGIEIDIFMRGLEVSNLLPSLTVNLSVNDTSIGLFWRLVNDLGGGYKFVADKEIWHMTKTVYVDIGNKTSDTILTFTVESTNSNSPSTVEMESRRLKIVELKR